MLGVFQAYFANLPPKHHINLYHHILTNQEFQNHTTNQRKQKPGHVAELHKQFKINRLVLSWHDAATEGI